MIIKNNMNAVRSRNQLKENDTKLAKDLKKISSGEKINSAEDGASEYSISRRMQVMMRSLDQDIDNTKTGRNLVATAEGGIKEIINNLRNMKAMAINSANDHNTDADRATLEKEFSNRMDTITDIAATTNYNGRLLLNGDYPEPFDRMETVKIPHYSPKTITVGPPSYTVVPNGNGGFTYIQDNAVTGLLSGFSAMTGTTTLTNAKFGSGEVADYGFSAPGYSNPIKITMDFTKANLNGGTLPTVLDGQGFTMGCGVCNQYITFKFDANSTTSSLNRSAKGDDMAYVIGVQGVTDLKDLAKAVFDGIASTSYASRKSSAGSYETPTADSSTATLIDGHHDLHIETDGTNFYISKKMPAMVFIDKGIVVGSSKGSTPGATGTISIQQPTTMTITDVTYTNEDRMVHHDGKPLIIHTGPKSNQYLPVFINSMHPIAMGLNGAKIVPREEALKALDTVDHAIDYALNEVTRMGAYQSRLNETESSLVTSNENVTASESTIVDADIAKLMVEYTKNSVLSQSAQLMLAQANQNSSSVLSLLQ